MIKDKTYKDSFIAVKGTFYYSAAELFKQGRLKPGESIILLHDADNQHDSYAIEVLHASTKSKLGYLSRNIAKKYYQLIQKKRVVSSEIAKVSINSDEISVSIKVTTKYLPPNLPSFIKRTEDSSAVYFLINNSFKRMYVGSSKNLKTRLRNHFTDLSNGWHQNELLQTDYLQGGIHDFELAVIPVDDDKAMREKIEAEQILTLLKRNINLYNMTKDGRGMISNAKYEGLMSISDVTVNAQGKACERSFEEFRQQHQASLSTGLCGTVTGTADKSGGMQNNEQLFVTDTVPSAKKSHVSLLCPKCKRVSRVTRNITVCDNVKFFSHF